ncbi:MAG: hypothetical protein ACYC3I_05240 [Gemmataceae bacterium]
MTDYDDERDDGLREEEELLSNPSQGNRPLLLAAVGLTLMLGGYAAVSYVPAAARQAETQHRLQQLRVQAEQRQEVGGDRGWPEQGNQAPTPWRNPPYQMAGRLAIYGGLFLFVLAVVRMYRSSPAPTKDSDEGTCKKL